MNSIPTLTGAQSAALARLYPQLDGSKAGFFQSVKMTDSDEDILRTLPINIIAVHHDEVFVSDILLRMRTEYEEQQYWLAHADEPIRELGIDIETYSSEDIARTGVYKYAEADDFAVLLFAYSAGGSPVRVVDIASGEALPGEVREALTNPAVLKTAYNAAFERVCLSRYLGVALQPEQWDCTMVRAARLALPLSLAQCSAVLGLTQQKMKEGAGLINYFSKPCRPTKANGERTRNLPWHAPDKWTVFKRYCKRDVEVEQAIRRKVVRLEISEEERGIWLLDQHINDRGILIDIQMARKAAEMDDTYRANLHREAQLLTGLENPGSPVQLKAWLKEKTGLTFKSIDKQAVADALPSIKSKRALRILRIRQELGKTSTAKYKAMLACACKDDRVRGLFQFYGANRTGRWAGRLLQLQNLPQNHITDLDYARTLVKTGTLDDVCFEFGNVPQLLSELIRTALIAKPDHTFIVCDFSAIEARVVAWLAGESWVLDTFRAGGDIYCATASQMFGVPVEKHGRNAELRAKGKIATLACGYGGGLGALKAMGADRMGLTDEEIKEVITKWRTANPRIVRFWRHAEDAVRIALEGDAAPIERGIQMQRQWGGISITLPSGRRLFYPRMKAGAENRLEYEGVNQETHARGAVDTYGGKIVENITQAIARDCLALTMLRLDKAGFKIVCHIHDETVIEATKEQRLEDVEEIFKQDVPWAPGLPLRGAGYTTPYYLKD